MKRHSQSRIVLSAVALALATLTGFARAADNPDLPKLVEGNSQFACDLYTKVAAGGDQNIFLSPYSISTALGMTYAGARGNTEKQMAATLHFDLPQDRLHAAFSSLGAALGVDTPPVGEGKPPSFQLVTANGLWKQKNVAFLDAFLAGAKKNYAAELRDADFKTAFEPARLAINDWVANQTLDKIKDLIAPGVLKPNTRMVLANAIYFKAAWQNPFGKAATQDGPFTLGDGKTVQTPLMREKKRLTYFEDDTLQAVQLPYVRDQLSMLVLVPRKPDGLPALEKQLSAKMFVDITAAAKLRLVDLTLPRFKTTAHFSLADTLAGMGMAEAFSDDANFSGMTGDQTLYISAVEHQAFVNVDEEGTEAAAATAGVMAGKGAPRPEDAVTVKVDRPFFFLVRHNATGAIVFMGRVTNPAAGTAAALAPATKRAQPIAIAGQADARAPGYIVLFENTVNAAAEVARLEKLYNFTHTHIYDMPGFKGFAGTIAPEAIKKLRWEMTIKSIEHDGTATINAAGAAAN